MNCRILQYTYCSMVGLVSLLTVACSGVKSDKTVDDEGVSTVLPEKQSEVTVLPLKRQLFNHELVSNGKVTAGSIANLRFETAGVVSHIYVKNGDRVGKGQKLAELDKFHLKNKTAQTRDALAKAKLELQDVLIGQGYTADDTIGIPADVMRLARIKSGYDQSMALHELAKYEEDHATLTAPISGVVANLFSKPFNAASTTDVFCSIVGTQNMEADFTVLESELPLVKKGDKVVVIPYSNTTARYEGRISEINPLVDDKGMVRMKAVVDGQGQLFMGMNIRVNVHRSIGNQLVIPKSAVVLRSGKQVVFTLQNGKARWNYVQTGVENSEYYTVVDDGITEGDTVIVTGNVNLANEAPVSVVNN